MEKSVSLHIVTYNSARHIRACLESIARQTHRPEEVIVVDNASEDDSAQLADRAPFPVRLIRNEKNLGYSAAHNQAIRLSKSPLILILNPDVILEASFLSKMIDAAGLDKKIGTVCGKLFRLTDPGDAGPPQQNIIDSTGIFMTPNQRHLDRGGGELDRGQYEEKEWVFGASGAAPLYRRKMLEDIRIDQEYFDEDFFCYREDADLSWRAQLLGWRTLYTPEAIAYHARRVRPENRRQLPSELNMHSVKNRFLLRLKNQTVGASFPFLVPMFFRDMQLLVYVLLLERSSLPGLVFPWKNFSHIMKKRKQIMERRRISNREMIAWFRHRSFPFKG